ncbi:MAG TPA: ABC transporter ATP-binding protein [Phycisphaerae bacterium]|nr:ABC transporter ATP-binding protein [Phycisphaerae bacterium]
MVAIDIESVSKRFPTHGGHGAGGGTTAAVDGVTLKIPSGSLFFLLGPSGCGKTTLLRMIAGFTMPTEGHIAFDGEDMTYVPPYKRDTGMVFQSYALWPHMTIADNVGFGLDVRKVKGADRAKRVDEALEMVQMGHLKDRKPNQLSGGQQQRVALARALAIRPKCLLLDEPLSNLDAKLRLEMRTEIRRIVKATGITAIYVTHDQKEALSMADGIAVMKSGKLQQTGTPADLYKHPVSKFVADFIGESNFLPATVESVNGSMITLKTAVGPMVAAVAAQKKSVAANQKVLAAFRPEAIGLSGGGAMANRIEGKRVSTTYLGEMAEHVVEVGGGAGGQRVKAFEMNPRYVRPSVGGEAMTLYVNAGDVMVVGNDE